MISENLTKLVRVFSFAEKINLKELSLYNNLSISVGKKKILKTESIWLVENHLVIPNEIIETSSDEELLVKLLLIPYYRINVAKKYVFDKNDYRKINITFCTNGENKVTVEDTFINVVYDFALYNYLQNRIKKLSKELSPELKSSIDVNWDNFDASIHVLSPVKSPEIVEMLGYLNKDGKKITSLLGWYKIARKTLNCMKKITVKLNPKNYIVSMLPDGGVTSVVITWKD